MANHITSRCVRHCPLVNPDVDFLSKIHADASFLGDVTFLALARVICEPNMKDGDKMDIVVKNLRPGQGLPDPTDHRKMVEQLMPNRPDTIYIYGASGSNALIVPVFDAVEKIPEFYPGWVKSAKIAEFIKSRTESHAAIFMNPEIRSTFVCLERMDIPAFHLLGCAIPGLIPWYYNTKDAALIKEHLISAITDEENPDKLLEAFQRVQDERYDIRSARIDRSLGDFESRNITVALSGARDTVKRIEAEIASHFVEAAKLRTQWEEKKALIRGYEAVIHNDKEGELSRYFKTNPNIDLLVAEGQRIDFIVRGYLDNFSEDTESYLDHPESNYIRDFVAGCYDCGEYDRKVDEFINLLNAVLIEQTVKLRVCGRVSITFPKGVNTDDSYRFDFLNDEHCGAYDTYMPNIHIDQFACFGRNYDEIAKLASDGDYIGAIEQAASAVRSFDIADSSVGKAFIETLITGEYDDRARNTNCFELPNGDIVDVDEAIDYVNGRR